MTFSINPDNVGDIVAVASIIGTIVSILVVSLIVYLLVRPPRHVRRRRKAEKRGEIRPLENDPYEVEQLWRMVDRMEERLSVVERAIDEQQTPRLGREHEEIIEPVGDREAGRTK
ncbi:MAG: hypothetical protein ACT4N8_10100 [Sphingosinicella sp.]|uniref:hypothetical protein n=1 Tax=Sphingosinicella sp. TaxID=1917971 RepID=UPI0040383CF8